MTTFDRWLVRIALAFMVLGAGACAERGHYVWVHKLPPQPLSDGRNLINAGDLVEVKVYGDEDSSSTGRVLRDGTLMLPLLGPVPVVGKRPEELATSLEQQLTRYVQTPKVTVLIRESVVNLSVIGEIKTPGTVDLVAPATVLEALAKAGGLTEFADESRIFVLRTVGDKTERIRFTYDALIQAEPAAARFQMKTGDVLVVE